MRSGEPKLLGVHVGGCCLPHQYEISKILKLILQDKWKAAIKALSKVIRRIKNSGKYESGLQKEFNNLKLSLAIKNKQDSISELFQCISMIGLFYAEPLEIDHNVAFPVWNPIFNLVSKAIRNFKKLSENSSYKNKEDFYRDLIK